MDALSINLSTENFGKVLDQEKLEGTDPDGGTESGFPLPVHWHTLRSDHKWPITLAAVA